MAQLPPMLPPVSDEDATPDVAAVYADIRATRGTDFVNAFWRVLAHDPALLKRTWEDLKAVMAPGALDPLVKELVYVAVSITNGCTYCINSHVAAARAKGMSDAQLMELIGVVGMANETNRLVTGLQVPVDAAFLTRSAAPQKVPGTAGAASRANGAAHHPAPADADAAGTGTKRARGRTSDAKKGASAKEVAAEEPVATGSSGVKSSSAKSSRWRSAAAETAGAKSSRARAGAKTAASPSADARQRTRRRKAGDDA